MRWINGKKTELLPPIDNDDFPKQYTCRVYGDDPHSGCVAVFNATAEEMRKVNEDGYWEWLDESESSSPLPLKDGQREPGCTCNFDYSGEPLIGGYARCSVHSPDKNYDKEELEHFLKKAAPKQSPLLKDIVQEMEENIRAAEECGLSYQKSDKRAYADFMLEANTIRRYLNKLKQIGSESYWKKETERLKGLIARMYNELVRAAENTSPAVSEDNWRKFQKDNNLESSIGEETEGQDEIDRTQWIEKEEYDQAVNEIGQLQEQLKEAENYIRDLSKGYEH